MRGKVSLLLTLTAWLLATGSHWDVVQVGAWGRMFAQNIRVLPLSAALKLTFSEEGRCNICNAVSNAKQEEAEQAASAAGKQSGKMLVFVGEPTFAFERPAPPVYPVVATTVVRLARSAPPVPPPRA